jgi:probable F420-dependent oxidoreductase
MQLGVLLPPDEIGTDPAAIREFAIAVEGLGYEYLLAYDHVLGADPSHYELDGPYTHRSLFHEPLTLFGFLAGCTKSVKLITGVLVLPQRQTALVAKQASEVALLSNGRLILGVGTGWNRVEYLALGADFGTRGAREEEQIDLLRQLWSKDLVSVEGRFHSFSHAGINPRPNGGEIPIWIGGWASVVIERAARLADGWLPFPSHPSRRGQRSNRIWTPSDLELPLSHFRSEAEKLGRKPELLQVCVQQYLNDISVSDQVRALEGWASAGATHCTLSTMGLGQFPDKHLQALRRLRAELGL